MSKHDDGAISFETNSKLNKISEEEDCNESLSDNESLDSIIKGTLTDLLQEGILENVLPYLTTKRKSNPVETATKCPSNESIKSKSTSSDTLIRERQEQSIEIQPKSDCEIEIHVYDEPKNLKKDFKCSRKLLLKSMGYFGEVATGMEGMEITVYCDIDIFEWIMKWVKNDGESQDSVQRGPELNAANVMPVLVSASLLEMEPLLDICLRFCKENMNEILELTVNLPGLSDNILTRLGSMFSNEEVENVNDQKNKFKPRLYCNLITSLVLIEPETWRGHYSSLVNIYKCLHCKKLIPRGLSLEIPCSSLRMRMNPNGSVVALHYRDKLWNLTNYISSLKADLKSWRNVYWRLWAECHFLYCSTCSSYYSLYQENTCQYHPNEPEFYAIEDQRAHPIGKYLCCGAKAYKFETIKNIGNGCKTQKHTPLINYENNSVLKVLNKYRDIIFSLTPIQISIGKKKPPEKNYFVDKNCSVLQGGLYKIKKGLLVHGMEKTNEESIKFAINSRVSARVKLALLPPQEVGWPKRHGHIEEEAYRVDTLRDSPSATDYVTDCRRCPRSTCVNNLKHKKCKNKKKVPEYKDESLEDEESEMMECCLPLQEINKGEEDMNKPLRYARKEERPSRHTKLCGLSKNQWVSKFSTRYNQDNQRNYEEVYFSLINAMLSRRIISTNLFNEKIMYENLACVFLNKLTPVKQSKASVVYSAFPKYCSALTAAARLHQSSAIWNYMTPLGGTYVRIEAKWREEENIPSSTLVSNSNSTQSTTSSVPRPRTRNNRSKPKRSECGLKWNIGHACGFGGDNVYTEVPYSDQDSRKRAQFWEFDRTTKELGYIPSVYLKIPKEMVEDKIRTLQVQAMEKSNPDWVKLMEIEEKWKNVLKLINTAERVPLFRRKLIKFLEKSSNREISPNYSESHIKRRKSTTSMDIYTEDNRLIIDMTGLPKVFNSRTHSKRIDSRKCEIETTMVKELPQLHLPKIKKL